MGAIVALAIVACGSTTGATTPASGSASADNASPCTSDYDCMLVDACCNCANGGGKIAIRKDQLELYNRERPKECANTVCAEMVSGDRSCYADATCHRGQCSVSPHSPDQTHGTPR